MQTIVNLGTGGADLNGQNGSTTSADSNDALFLDWPGDNAGNYIYVPDDNSVDISHAASLDLVDDLQIDLHFTQDSDSGSRYLIRKGGALALLTFGLRLDSDNKPRFYVSDGTTGYNVAASEALSLTVDTPVWLRVTKDASTGDVEFFTSDDGSTWSQLGTTVSLGYTGSAHSNTSDVELMAWSTLDGPGKLYRARFYDGIAGSLVADVDTASITSGSVVTFTDGTGDHTVTINRSTSGRKSVAVVSPVWLFGTDDFMDVADNALLNFDANESFTLLVIGRQWATPPAFARFLDKEGSTLARYMLRQNSTSLQATTQVVDAGGTSVTRNSATFSAGQLVVLGALVDRVANEIRSSVNTSLSDATSIASVASLVNDGVLRVGSRATSVSLVNDMELFGVLVFRRLLSSSEISSITSYYQARLS